MTELGQTSDPTVLIPGNPSEIERRAHLLRRAGEQYQQSGDALKRVTVSGWTGAAADAFHASFTPEPPKWETAGTSTTTVSRALFDLADAVRAAQRQASEAIELWKRGEQGGAGTDTSAASATASGVPPPASAENEYQQRAREVLNEARTTLHSAGDHAAGVINGSNAQKRTDNAVNNLVKSMTAPMSASGKAEASGPTAGVQGSTLHDGKLGKLKAYAYLAQASAEGKTGNEFANLTGKAEANVGADAKAEAGLTKNSVIGQAQATVGAQASAEGNANLGPLGAKAKGEGFGGARAEAGGEIGKEGVKGHAGAFAGAKAKGEVGGDVGGIGVNGTGEAWAGAGVEADIDVSYENGEFHMEGSAGAALGLGGKVGGGVTVDPGKIVDTAEGVADTAGDAAHAVGDAAESGVDTVKSWF